MKHLLRVSIVVGMLGATSAQASSNKCQNLKEELKAMRQAQSQIMQSLVNNHESFASSLEEYSVAVGVTPNKASKEMNKTANAFRNRGIQGKRIAEKLDKATGDLIARVSQCL